MGSGVSIHGEEDLVQFANSRDVFSRTDLEWLSERMCKAVDSTEPFEDWFVEHSKDGEVIERDVLLQLVDDLTEDCAVTAQAGTYIPENKLHKHEGALNARNIRDDTGESKDAGLVVQHGAVAFDCGSSETKVIKLEYSAATGAVTVREVKDSKAPSIVDFVNERDIRRTKDYRKLRDAAEKARDDAENGDGGAALRQLEQNPMFFLKPDPGRDPNNTTLTPELFTQYIAETKQANVSNIGEEGALTVVIGCTATFPDATTQRQMERQLAQQGSLFKNLTSDEEQHFESAAIAFAAAQIGSPVDAFVGCGGGHTHFVEHLTTDRLMVDTAWKVLKAQISDTCAVRAMIAMRTDAENAAQQVSKHQFTKTVQKARKVLPPRSRTAMNGLRLSAEDMVTAADDVLQSHKALLQANDKNPTGGKLKALPALGSVGQSVSDRPPVVIAIGACHYAAKAAGIANGPGDNNMCTVAEVLEKFEIVIANIKKRLLAAPKWQTVWEKEGMNFCNIGWQRLVFEHFLTPETKILFKREWDLAHEPGHEYSFITTWSAGWYLKFLHDLGISHSGSREVHEYYEHRRKVRESWTAPAVHSKLSVEDDDDDDDDMGGDEFSDKTLVVDCGAGETKTIMLTYDNELGIQYQVKGKCPPIDAFFAKDFRAQITANREYKSLLSKGTIKPFEFWFLRAPERKHGPVRPAPGILKPQDFVDFCQQQQMLHKADRVVIGMQRSADGPAQAKMLERVREALDVPDATKSRNVVFYLPTLSTEEAAFEVASTHYATELLGMSGGFDAIVACSTTDAHVCSAEGHEVASPSLASFGLKPLEHSMASFATTLAQDMPAAEAAALIRQEFDRQLAILADAHSGWMETSKTFLLSRCSRSEEDSAGGKDNRLDVKRPTVIFMGAAAFAAASVDCCVHDGRPGAAGTSLASDKAGGLARFTASEALVRVNICVNVVFPC
eukprot:INCI7672.1.p1 GENE.INCI7672.1~~INCI7672.1.p1  ORF type:complete len:974 (+),score=191.53 INCI7672.1:60-2924(+)